MSTFAIVISVQVFGELSSIAGINARINPPHNVNSSKQSLSSVGNSEASLNDPSVGQSTPTTTTHKLADTKALINIPETEGDSNREEGNGIEQHEYAHHNSLDVPSQRLSSPYNRHRGAEYYPMSTSADDTNVLEVSLNIPDHPDNNNHLIAHAVQ